MQTKGRPVTGCEPELKTFVGFGGSFERNVPSAACKLIEGGKSFQSSHKSLNRSVVRPGAVNAQSIRGNSIE